MKEQWLSVKEVAELLGMTERAVRKKIKEGKLKARVVKGGRGGNRGRKYQVALSALPLVVQMEYFRRKGEKLAVKHIDEYSEKERKEAFRRYSILREFWRVAESAVSRRAVAEEVARKYGLSRATLQRWEARFKRWGIAGLVPGHGRGRGKEAEFSQEAKDFALSLYLTEGRPTASAVYQAVVAMGKEKGWKVPSYRTFTRFLNTIPKAVKVYYREGRKAWQDKIEPYLERDYSSLRPYQIVVADHHQIDVAALVYERGRQKVVFPWLTALMDMRSRKIVGWQISLQPNSDTINLALRHAIRRFGIMEELYLDNGKDFRAKRFTGGITRFRFEVDRSHVEGLYKALGIITHFAIPYNAKAKSVERFFRTFEKEFSVWLKGYRGSNTKERPEKLKREIKRGDLYTFEELREMVGRWIENVYNNRPHKALEMRSPNEVFAEGFKKMRVVSEEALRVLAMKWRNPLTVQRNGIWLFDRWFWAEELVPLVGDKVVPRYDPDDLSEIYIYDLQGKFICVAKQKTKAHFAMTEEEWKKQMRAKKVARRFREAFKISQALVPDSRLPYMRADLKQPRQSEPDFVEIEKTVADFIEMQMEEKKRRQEELEKVQRQVEEMLFRQNPGGDEDEWDPLVDWAKNFKEV